MRLNDSTRRGLRTAIDVLLSAATSGLILLVVNYFKEPDMTVEQFTVLNLALTPVLSSIKNALEDKAGASFLVSKVRPEPDPVDRPDEATVQPTEREVFGDQEEIQEVPDHFVPETDRSQRVMFAKVPRGHVLIAVPANEVSEADTVVGFTR